MILVEDLTYWYAPGTPLAVKALDGVSFSLAEGKFMVLAGGTGSGKTTLAQHLNGLLLPSSGRVQVGGRDTREEAFRRQLWRTVGLLWQYPERQFFEETVYREVAFALRNLGADEEYIRERVAWALRAVGLNPAEVLDLSPFALSGGMRRRVALASVLVYRPRVLVLDEPTAGLDPASREHILGLLKKLQEEEGHTVILITHRMEEAARLADWVVVLSRGRVCLQGTPREVFQNPAALKEAGLHLPFPCRLMHRLREEGLAAGTAVLTLEEAEAELERLRTRGRQH
ncbi:energy-coupling factor transporter ATPase [Desulfovirgula thermocuniculi]|uniref:energy-coupling factor transporter ATPase n=1 Tax=Desulfovirgula thermocuniculi TaxID=348842 RepID=UPI0003FA72E4|nr:energy-coupling factor transporter ATPase [Desulfovirgula thermocuniculi]